eukprot:TRINITY_DN1020_c0_g3_i1.p1 TRINITY_DN1020_c0_g3~~TRINITY_DN1020_c0_g3_i1.p1  ORF type:complete len:365 (+),score=134.61 TRINITY_DN1020_c0_g3_i1:75-1169(+)
MSRVLVLGASGLLGQGVTRKLIEHGCTVIGTGRTGRGFDELKKLGASPRQFDVLDRSGVESLCGQVGHVDAVVNLMSKMPQKLRAFGAEKDFEEYNRIRLLGTKHLMKTIEATCRPERVIATSHTYVCSPGGKTYVANPGENASLDKHTARDMLKMEERYDGEYAYDYEFNKKDVIDVTNMFSYASEYPWVDAPVSQVVQEFNGAAYRLERLTAAYKHGFGIVLRLGFLHGPGTAFGKGGAFREDMLAGKVKVVGHGYGQWSFLHVDDATDAIVKATTNKSDLAAPGVMNVCDYNPTSTNEWMARYAYAVGAKKPPGKVGSRLGMYFCPHLFFYCSMQRAAYYPGFPNHYDWEPKRGPMWEPCD